MKDLYQEVTNSILDSLEKGVTPWVKPWRCTEPFGGIPYNITTGRPYRGINILLLAMSPFGSNAWLTFNQAKAVGAHVKKGSKASTIVFYKTAIAKSKEEDEKARTFPMLRSYAVFNIEQVENLPSRLLNATTSEIEMVHEDRGRNLLAKATVLHGGDRALYHPASDTIRLPEIGQFASREAYLATAMHELTHWTGAPTRLAREYGKRFGDTAYAREELVAEMGAAFLCASLGIQGNLQHPEYIGNWIKVLKDDKRAVLTAASHAQKATDFVLGTSEE